MATPVDARYPIGGPRPLVGGSFRGGKFAGSLSLGELVAGGGLGLNASALSSSGLALADVSPSGGIGTGMPAWLMGAAVGQWAQISNTAVPYELKDYCGFGLRDDVGVVEMCSAAAGGHSGNILNNRVMTLDLTQNAPVWVTRLGASDPTGWPTNGSGGAYFPSDGRPVPRHTYDGVQWIAELGGYALQGRFFGTDGRDARVHDLWNPTTNSWSSLGDRNPAVSTDTHDPSTGIYYSTVGNNSERWTPATGQWFVWTLSGSAPIGRLGNAFDTARGQIFHLSTGDGWATEGANVNCCKISTGGAKTAITFNASAAWSQFQASADRVLGSTLQYNPDLDVFYFYAGQGQTIYVITPNSGTTWDMDVMPVTGATPPNHLPFGKFKYSRQLKCLLVAPANADAGYNVHFIRTQ